MAQAAPDNSVEIFNIGATGDRAAWLSHALMGIAAPILTGLVLVPQVLEGAGWLVGAMLAAVLGLSIVAYGLSVLVPGSPSGVVVRMGSREVAIVRHGLLAKSEVLVPFAEVMRVSIASGADRDGYDRSALELRTRSGDTWIVPCGIDAADLAHVRRMIGHSAKPR